MADEVIIGVLDERALMGYKNEVVPFKERYYILRTVAAAFPNIRVIRQSSLNPQNELMKYECDSMASGDGWEPSERVAAESLGVELIDIDSGYKGHSSDLLRNP